MSILCVSIFGIRFVYEYFEFGFSAMGPRGATASVIQASVAWGGGDWSGVGGKWLRGKGGFPRKNCHRKFNSCHRNIILACESRVCSI
jgi:hypothetical protein